MDFEPSDQELTEKEDNNFLKDLFNLIRSNEVLGQILKNYYSAIKRNERRDYIKNSLDAYLRLIAFVVNEALKDTDSLQKHFEDHITSQGLVKENHNAQQIATRFIASLITTICSGLIMKSADGVLSKKLIEDVEFIADEEGTNAYKLIQFASLLLTPNIPSVNKLKHIIKSMDENLLSKSILQDIAMYHIHMFHTPDAEKQKIGSLVSVNFKSIKPLGLSIKD